MMFTCDNCGADIGDMAIPSKCSALVIPSDIPDVPALIHWCVECRDRIVSRYTTYKNEKESSGQ
jgi:hypothetical protein